MEISKKDLLKLTNISYGQLYRWKRKGLIPDSWFRKKSSYTGQETYFPKEEVVERINKILELKDIMPLEEIKEYFDGSHFLRVYKKSEVESFENSNYLSENVSYYELISLEIINNIPELINDLDNISDKLNEDTLDSNFYYFKSDLWLIATTIKTNSLYTKISIKDIVQSVNKKLENGGVL